MSDPLLPDTASGTLAATPSAPLQAEEADPYAGLPESPVGGALEARLLEEQALDSPYDATRTPPSEEPWELISISVATANLRWAVLYPQLEDVQEGAVLLLPTTRSGWLKVIKGTTPTTSEFYIRRYTTLLAEPGSLAASTKGPAVVAPHPLERVHFVLDVVGLAPVIGEPADAVNTVLYFLEGDTLNGALSMMAMIPIGGDAAVLAKWSAKYGEGIVDFGLRSTLRKTMGLSGAKEAHHIIPWQLQFHEIVQAAGREGFQMNDFSNGYPLKKYNFSEAQLALQLANASRAAGLPPGPVQVLGMHGSHSAYNFYVMRWLETFVDELGGLGNIDPLAARELLEKTIIPGLTELIDECVSLNRSRLNEFFEQHLRWLEWFDEYEYYAKTPSVYSWVHGTNALLNDTNILFPMNLKKVKD